MRVSLIKNGKMYNTDLPTKIGGSFWIEDRDKNNIKRNLVNIEAHDGKWILKSNYGTQIISGGKECDEIAIEDYSIFELQIKGEQYSYILCSYPSYDDNSLELRVSNNAQIIIGNGPNNSINYNNIYVADKQCMLTYSNNLWGLKNLGTNAVVFLNGIATNEANLNVGDVVFIMNLKIVICGEFIIINKPKGFVGYDTRLLTVREPLNVEIEKVDFNEEEDTELKVYEKTDYFFKMPRFKTSVEEEEVNIDPPPEQETRDEMPLAYTLGPMITMGITSMVSGVTSMVGVMGGQQTVSSALPSLITCGAMMLSTFLWPNLQKKYSDKQAKQKERKRIKKYNEYIDERRNYIKGVVAKQRQSLIQNNLPLEECKQIILNRKRNLWERKIEHDDFLNVRVGIGNVEPYVKVMYPEEHFSLTENNLRETLDKLGEETKLMTDVPVTINLAEKYISAIIGKKSLTKSFLEGLLLQIMTFHSYDDLKIVIMTSKENEHLYEFLKTTPYITDDERQVRFFSTDVDEATQLSTSLDNYFQNRSYSEDGSISEDVNYKSFKPYFLIITDDYQSLRNIGIIKSVLGQKQNFGFSMLIIQERLLGLPNECTTFINVDTNQSAIFENELTKDKQQVFKADYIGNINLKEISKVLSNIPIEISSETNLLPDKVGFLEMYGVGKIEQLNILNRWAMNNPISSLSAPVGVDTNGELFKLDLHEKFYGPHGLVAGMTGSGKSEFIITYILSMAINYHPDEVSFVLIDYKGGGLAGAFENKETGVHIPHLAGTITNLDVNDMKRSLASIRSELKRRQSLFNDARQKLNESTIDIYKYQRLRREGKVDEPIPHLFIISDEFAELKTQQPEFMEQLISTARIGRSLGVHLILATQKPSGVVDDQIWSNTKFRVCLKVQDRSDSMDMIKCPDAASLHNVGRFYLQVGYNEFFALGQSAYAGVQYQNTDKVKRKVDTNIDFINNVGYVIKSVNNDEKVSATTQYGEELSNIVKCLYDLGKEENVFTKQLWLDKIPEDIYVDELAKKYNYQVKRNFINPIIGEYDDPNTQSQHLLTLKVQEGNLIIYGATGMGKEDLLSTIIYSTIACHTTEEVNFYIIDCGSETLKLWEGIPQVGDVMLSNETEKINNLFKMISQEIERRKKLFQQYGGNYNSYIEQSGQQIPTIVVMVNLYEAFIEMYETLEDTFNTVTREGVKYGIIFIVTTSGTNFIGYRLKQNFKQEFTLQLNSEDDYFDIVGNTHGLYPSKIKGRGLIKIDEIYEFQSAKYKNNGNNFEFIKQLGIEMSKKLTKAQPIRVLPRIVNFDVIKDNITGLNSVPIGIDKNSLQPSLFNFKNNLISLVTGSDPDAFLGFVPELVKVISNLNISLTVVDAERMFEDVELNCEYYVDNFDDVFNTLNSKIEQIGNQELVIVITGMSKFKEGLSFEIQEKLADFITNAKNSEKVSIIDVDLIDAIGQLNYDDWYKNSWTSNYGIWLGDGAADQYTINVSKTPRDSEGIGNKFGYNITKGNARLIKTINCFGEEDLEDEE